VSRFKFDRSQEFIPGYKTGGGHWCSVAVQSISKPEICHGAGFQLRADARCASRSFSEGWCPAATAITYLPCVQEQKLKIRQPAEKKSRPWRGKKCDKQLTHIVRVISRPLLTFLNYWF
jgi:hypothetical protein